MHSGATRVAWSFSHQNSTDYGFGEIAGQNKLCFWGEFLAVDWAGLQIKLV